MCQRRGSSSEQVHGASRSNRSCPTGRIPCGPAPADKDFAHVSPARPHARARVPAMARCAEDTKISLGLQRPQLLRRSARAVTHLRSALAARLGQPAALCRRQHQYDQFSRDGAYFLRSVWPMRVLGRLQPRGSAQRARASFLTAPFVHRLRLTGTRHAVSLLCGFGHARQVIPMFQRAEDIKICLGLHRLHLF